MCKVLVKSVLLFVVLIAWSVDGYGLTVDTIQINQAVVKNDGSNFGAYVAGKNTVVRVKLSEAVEIDEETTYVAAVNTNSSETFYLDPKRGKNGYQENRWVNFHCPSMKKCQNWSAGTYSFDVYVNNEKKKTLDNVVFREQKTLKVLLFPINSLHNYGTDGNGNDDIEYGTVTKEDIRKVLQFTEKVYPVSKIVWDIRNVLDLSNDTNYNFADANNPGGHILQLLSQKMGEANNLLKKGDKKYDSVMGFIGKTPGERNSGYQGFAQGNSALSVITDQDAAATVAHELAHLFGIGDTYNGDPRNGNELYRCDQDNTPKICTNPGAVSASFDCDVNPPPLTYWGRKMVGDGFTHCDSKNRAKGETASAASVLASSHPYDVVGGKTLTGKECYMGSGGKMPVYWTTSEVYAHLFEQLKIDTTTQSLAQEADLVEQNYIDYFGTISIDNGNGNGIQFGNNITLDEFTPFSATADEADVGTSGNYTVVALDDQNNVLATSYFSVQPFIMAHPPIPRDFAEFDGTILFPNQTAKFEVRKEDGTPFEPPAVRTVSANAPVVSNVTFVKTSSAEEPYKIEWVGQDADNDKLTWTVLYNPDVVKDEGNWWELAGDLEDLFTWNDSLEDLPGGKNAVVRVIASDGVREGYADSTSLDVPVKKPEVMIFDDEDDTSYEEVYYEEGWDVFLEADIYDIQERGISDDVDNIVWTSNLKQESLGKGTFLVVDDLPLGKHTITVTVTYDEDQKITDQIKINVVKNLPNAVTAPINFLLLKK